MTIKENKAEYNQLLKRYQKANEYFENKDISQAEKEMFLPEFQKVLSGMSFLLGEIKLYTKQEVMEGFDDKDITN